MKLLFVCVLTAGTILFVPLVARAQAIEACVHRASGNVKIVASTQHCGNSEARVIWNIAGTAGEAGPAGPAGATGAAGTPGESGPAGPAGPTLVIVDSSQPAPIEVGYLVDTTKLLTTAANESDWFALPFASSGFPEPTASTLQIYYVGPNCQGQGYVATTSFGKPIIEGTVWNGQVLYATGPLAFVAPAAGSVYRFNQCTMMDAPFNGFPPAAPALQRPLTDFTVRPEGTLTAPLRVVKQ